MKGGEDKNTPTSQYDSLVAVVIDKGMITTH